MKKSILFLLLLLSSVGISAQTTWIARAGVGLASGVVDEVAPAMTAGVEANIPLKYGSSVVISPSLNWTLEMYDFEQLAIDAPILFGKKISMGNSLFVPKIGPVIGVTFAGEDSLILGPCAEFNFEIKHFVVGLSGYYSLVKAGDYYYYDDDYYYDHRFNYVRASLTFGYKF